MRIRGLIAACLPGALAGLLLLAPPARAHHSAAAYDFAVTNRTQGTITAFRWASPHCSLVIAVEGGDEITLTSGAPSAYVDKGFKPGDFKTGDRVEVTWHPGRGGGNIGALASIRLKDGRVFSE